ncbi:Exosome complex component CSL4 [Thelohanellus kitauei]|uniref:Exosome complex component CSL4 n=1 Tax=Thelohanellus kitauei TaxID=669202 RepID=A0A0C2M8U6_THEKT|nr:Exosome complex component CSL4 [Thelohanellus kitauei]KII60734.1 Exosome complex component CSL4 [Thelohanellus kitauei]
MEQELVFPGEIVGKTDEFSPGENVYVRDHNILASRVGYVGFMSDKKKIISIHPASLYNPNATKFYESIHINALVICKVKSFTDFQCKVDIICVNGKPLISSYRGVIHLENIRPTFENEFTKAYHSFRVGDFVLGRVVGVVDNRSARERVLFLISTAEPELGVILCKSPFDADSFMIPFSWKEMICPVTHKKELRKVAKVIIKEDE